MHQYLAKTLGGAAAALMVSGACDQVRSAQAVLAICPVGHSVPALHRLTLDSTGNAPNQLIVTDADRALPSDCRRSPLPFSAETVRWLGVLPGQAETGDRLAITAREKSGEILGIEEEKLRPPQPSRHLPSRQAAMGATLAKLPAAWVWNPQTWRADPGALIAAASRAGVGAFYISVSIAGDEIQDAAALVAFILQCGEAGIEVYAVEGDPKMITEEGLAFAVSRARALAAFRSAHPQATLAGVQYDIEPYLLASFGADPKAAWMRWSAALHSLSDALGEPVDAVIPYWIEDSPGGEDALAAARPALRSITIMAYRTELGQIMDAAAPALIFAERAGLPATVGLEAGAIAEERRSIFRRAVAGDLHLAGLGDVTAALLLDAPQPGTETRAFRRSHSVLSDPTRVSFFGRTPRLFDVARSLTTALTAYPAAQRIAFHGLSDFESPKSPSVEPQKDNPDDPRHENPAH
jgi:hypothetical protein